MQETKYEIYNTGVKFDPNMRNNVLVYEDIIGLLPKYTISQLGVNHTYLCQGITSEAKTVWVLISISDYEDYFDSENDLTLPYRIYGGTVYADDEFADINISGAEGFDEVSSLLFYFTELEVEEEG